MTPHAQEPRGRRWAHGLTAAFTAMAALAATATAQQDPIVFPDVAADGHATFRVLAPNARAAYFRSMSFTVLPAGIMGRTCSVYGTITSRTKGPSQSSISWMAARSSPFLMTRRPRTP